MRLVRKLFLAMSICMLIVSIIWLFDANWLPKLLHRLIVATWVFVVVLGISMGLWRSFRYKSVTFYPIASELVDDKDMPVSSFNG